MIILFMACCDAPLPNGISHIQMEDSVVHIDNLVWYPIWQKCINGKHGHQYRSISKNLIRFMVSDFCLWWDLVFLCMAWLVMINSCVHSISHKCPNDIQYSKTIKIQLGPKALVNLVPAIKGNQPFSLKYPTFGHHGVNILWHSKMNHLLHLGSLLRQIRSGVYGLILDPTRHTVWMEKMIHFNKPKISVYTFHDFWVLLCEHRSFEDISD